MRFFVGNTSQTYRFNKKVVSKRYNFSGEACLTKIEPIYLITPKAWISSKLSFVYHQHAVLHIIIAKGYAACG